MGSEGSSLQSPPWSADPHELISMGGGTKKHIPLFLFSLKAWWAALHLVIQLFVCCHALYAYFHGQWPPQGGCTWEQGKALNAFTHSPTLTFGLVNPDVKKASCIFNYNFKLTPTDVQVSWETCVLARLKKHSAIFIWEFIFFRFENTSQVYNGDSRGKVWWVWPIITMLPMLFKLVLFSSHVKTST